MEPRNTEDIKNVAWWQKRGRELLETGELSDAKIIIEYPNEPVREINVHKCLLYLVSPVWSSAVKWATDNQIKVTQYPYSVIYNLVKCAYVGELQMDTMQHCIGILKAAHFYDMPQPMEFCKQFLQQRIAEGKEVNLRDFVDLLNIVIMLNLTELKPCCFAYIEVNTKQFLFSEEFLDMSLESIVTLVTIQNYICDENTLIRSVLRWCTAHCDEGGLKQFLTDNQAIRNNFRWETLPADERSMLVSDYPDVFQGEPFTNLIYDEAMAATDARGEPNQQLSHVIVVRRPPFVVIETFTYFGEPIHLPIVSIQLAPRLSSIDHTFTKAHEDKFRIQIYDRVIEYEGPIIDPAGTTVNIPPPAVSMHLTNRSEFTIVIKLQKTGVYHKNSNFLEYGRGLFRHQEGIIQRIYSSDEPYFSADS